MFPDFSSYIANHNDKTTLYLDILNSVNIVDVLTGTGVASGKEMPLRLPLRRDSYTTVKETCYKTRKLLEEWKGSIHNTNHTE